jgi:hypothetical protein
MYVIVCSFVVSYSVHAAACIWPGAEISIDVIRATSRAQWISTSSNDPPASTCVTVGQPGQTGQTGQPGSPMQERATRVHIIDGASSRGPCPPHPSETKITPPTGQQGRQSRRDGVQPAADPRPLDGMARGASAVCVATAHDAQPSPQILAGHRGYDTPSPVVILDFDHCSLFLALFHGRREVHKTVACLPLISAVFTIARCLKHPHLHLHLHPA